MQLDLLMALKVLLAQKDIEVGGFLDRYIDLVGVFSTSGIGLSGGLRIVFLHFPVCPSYFKLSNK